MKFGVKVVDKSSTYNKKRLDKYMSYYQLFSGNEIAKYNGSDEFINGISYNICHSNAKILNINTFINNIDLIDEYLENDLIPFLDKYDVSKIVVHITNNETLEEYKESDIKKYIDYLSNISKIFQIKIYLENTHSNITEMTKLFGYNLEKNLNFTFDIGHAKAFSKNDSIDHWITFMKKFHNNIHIHFHSNYGENDDHLPITKKTLNHKTKFHNNKNYLEIAKEIISILENDSNNSFILETHPSYIKSNIEFFKKLGLL